MADTVSTCTAPFCRGEDCPRGVPISSCGVAAGSTQEGSFGQPQALLGSRTALRAGHRGVGGRNEHHLSARPGALFDQVPLRRTNRGVRRLARHRGAREELRLEVPPGARSST